MIRAALFLCLCAACSKLPETPTSADLPDRSAMTFPVLVPLDRILDDAAQPSRAQAAEGALQARRAGLAGRGISAPGTGDLAERGRRLRARAAELRAAQI